MVQWFSGSESYLHMICQFHDWNYIHNSNVNPDNLKATLLAPALNCQLYTQLLDKKLEERGGVRPTFPHLLAPPGKYLLGSQQGTTAPDNCTPWRSIHLSSHSVLGP